MVFYRRVTVTTSDGGKLTTVHFEIYQRRFFNRK